MTYSTLVSFCLVVLVSASSSESGWSEKPNWFYIFLVENILLLLLGLGSILCISKGWRRSCTDADTVTLDADSAHPCISIENRSFTHGTEILPVPPNPQRFDGIVALLGKDGFSSGNHYWEVDIGNSSDWDVGVARKSIKRKGNITLSPKEGFWVLGFTGRDYFAKTDPWTRITVQRKPERIGVHLRFQENKVTFFNVTDFAILFEFKACEFSEDIYPFFKNGDKGKTMHISP
ncbi:hypothetical protein JRQ81_005551 [Phrynocephalus forsythii]|uniref:B30.2/SPRY domain-containing protein n=1 Tax=Phrynocephalus forsythii TaxID=171643 RepID=A0A9Q0XGF3_9SAUR|nr:hypothetical protein JRQ81_005551 [Phrynocephalus forsythii]